MADYQIIGSGLDGSYIDQHATYNGYEYWYCSSNGYYLYWVNYWADYWCIGQSLGNPYTYSSGTTDNTDPSTATWSGITVAPISYAPDFTIAVSPTAQDAAIGTTGGNITTTIHSINGFNDAVDLSIIGYANTNSLINGDFESLQIANGSFQSMDSLSGTATWSGSGSLIHNSNPYGQSSHTGTQFALLQGAVFITQVVSGGAGTGNLSFWISGRTSQSGPNDVSVILNGVTLETITPPNSTWVQHTYSGLTLTGTDTLTFQANDTAGGDRSSYVDDVVLTGSITSITGAFSSSSITPVTNGNATSTLNLSLASGLTAGTYAVTIQGVNGATTHTTSVSLTAHTAETIPPVVASASVDSAGTTLTVNWTEADNTPVLPSTGGSGLSLAGMTYGAVTLSSVNTSGTTTTATLSRPIYIGEVITLSGTSVNFTDSAVPPNAVVDFSGVSVTNNSLQPAYAANIDLLCVAIYDSTASSDDINTTIAYLTNRYMINNAGNYIGSIPHTDSYIERTVSAIVNNSGGGGTVIEGIKLIDWEGGF